MLGPTAIPTGAPQLDELVATRGMAGMLNTVWLIICAMCFGGVMTGSGMLRSLTSIFLRWVPRLSAVASTVARASSTSCTRRTRPYLDHPFLGAAFLRDPMPTRGLEPEALSPGGGFRHGLLGPDPVELVRHDAGLCASRLFQSTRPTAIFTIVPALMSLLVAAVGWNINGKMKTSLVIRP